MKTVPCPRCSGSGVVYEPETTLVGPLPKLDRSTDVDDIRLSQALTEMREVPSFKVPASVRPPAKPIRSDRPPVVETPVVSEEITSPMKAVDTMSEPPPKLKKHWPTFVLCLAIGIAIGAGVWVELVGSNFLPK